MSSFCLQARQEQAQLEQQQWLQMQQVLQQQQQLAAQQQQQQQAASHSSDGDGNTPAGAGSEKTQTDAKQEGGQQKPSAWVPSVGNISIPPFPAPSNDEDDDYS